MNLADTSIGSLYEMDWLKNAEFKDGLWHYTLTEQEKVLVNRVTKSLYDFIVKEIDGLKKWKKRLQDNERLVGKNTIFHEQWERENEDLESLFCVYDEFNGYFEVKLVKTEEGYTFQAEEPIIHLIDDLKEAKEKFDARSRQDKEKGKKIVRLLEIAEANDAIRRASRRPQKSSWFDNSIIGGIVGAMGGEVLYDLLSDD